jgi:hypothetical protein
MATTVVNMHHKVPFDVYCGRPRGGRDPRQVPPGQPGFLGNPFPLGSDSREESIARFREYFLARVESDERFRASVLACRGKTLACFCKPRACHVDVVAAWLDAEGPQSAAQA